MTRKAFVADIASAAVSTFDGISKVTKGDDDGDVNFCFTPIEGPPLEIGLLAMDVSGYPLESSFLIFTRSSEIPVGIADALDRIAQASTGMGLLELLPKISLRLRAVLSKESGSTTSAENSDVGAAEEDEAESEDESVDMYSNDELAFESALSGDVSNRLCELSPENALKLDRRIREDLRATRLAGYKIGPLSGLKARSEDGIVSISLQVAKLGLSDEVIQAWDLEPEQYIVLLIRYSSGYKTFENVETDSPSSLGIHFRIGISQRYKPSLSDALAAFSQNNKGNSAAAAAPVETEKSESLKSEGFSSLFISSSLNEFMNGQLISLLKIRCSSGLNWDEAKKYYNEKRGRLDDQATELSRLTYKDTTPNSYADLDCGVNVTETDHISEDAKQFSFPLIAVQFAMRYLLHCTDYCLVCHDQISHGFGALKPYVCEKPLCLYQYMSLGFGPTIEHEILTQPYVVDLLVSFCYSSAMCRRIREYPTGMALMVPPIAEIATKPQFQQKNTTPSVVPLTAPSPREDTPVERAMGILTVKYDEIRHEIILDGDKIAPFRQGDWVIVATGKGTPHVHYRVEDISCSPIIKLSNEPISQTRTLIPSPVVDLDDAATAPLATTLVPANVALYEKNFDDLNDQQKCDSMILLLETIPSIEQMTQFLTLQSRSSELSLRNWKDRISPAALGLLRWIIASNRSCIVQVDVCPAQLESALASTKMRPEQKVLNIDSNWMQFRFAQGSPDKEQRFLRALQKQKESLPAGYPTIFAFHGSPMQNWHSIIRSGLDFNETLHGRAYGHGVYHAQDQATSLTYSGMRNNGCQWPASELKPSQVMSLNEIVNCPLQFQSYNPYLVVQHVDWIQCRYLFVETMGKTGASGIREGTKPTVPIALQNSDHVEQDPKFTAKATTKIAIGVPQCATMISRAFRGSLKHSPMSREKKPKIFAAHLSTESIADSENEDPADIRFLLSDDEDEIGDKLATKKLVLLDNLNSSPQTDFVSGSLDQSLLPMLEPPVYATSGATMRLNRELKTILDVQNRSPLHELGWFIDANLVTNVYQWIVELHSFDSSLPLARDMKAAGVNSIVLEIRFGKDYPHSPPFVRVIRPRFLPFTHGGGGHVTGGGAMCMELLTNSGWSAVSSIESVLLQVRMAIMNLEPKPARLESTKKAHQRDYSTGEAMQAYIRACMAHGWEVPKDFNDFAGGSERRL